MEVQQDYRDLLALFNAHKVEYLIVGAYALAYHGSPRYTGDLDILVRATDENAQRIVTALERFGFGAVGLSATDFSQPGMVIQLGVAPVRVDMLTSITGVSWEDAIAGCARGRYGDVDAPFLGRNEFIRNKQELGRQKDKADLEALGVG